MLRDVADKNPTDPELFCAVSLHFDPRLWVVARGFPPLFHVFESDYLHCRGLSDESVKLLACCLLPQKFCLDPCLPVREACIVMLIISRVVLLPSQACADCFRLEGARNADFNRNPIAPAGTKVVPQTQKEKTKLLVVSSVDVDSAQSKAQTSQQSIVTPQLTEQSATTSKKSQSIITHPSRSNPHKLETEEAQPSI
jgi:hypothetical protein